jgi:homoaconitase/3-isopropylmalate dehydratase large subunit
LKLEQEQDLIAPDEKTFEYFKNKPMSPKEKLEKALTFGNNYILIKIVNLIKK